MEKISKEDFVEKVKECLRQLKEKYNEKIMDDIADFSEKELREFNLHFCNSVLMSYSMAICLTTMDILER